MDYEDQNELQITFGEHSLDIRELSLRKKFSLMTWAQTYLSGKKVSVQQNNDVYQEVRNSRDFTDKVVLITGSSAGIGAETVKLFSALGASVVVTGRNEDGIRKVSAEAQTLSPKGLKPLEVVADLTKSDQLEQLIKATIDTFGKIDVLVNCAGVFNLIPFESDDFMKVLDNSLDIEVKPSLNIIKQSLPYLKKTKGTVINIATIFTTIPQSNFLPYVLAKTSMVTATKTLAQELGQFGIRVNSVSPGFILSHPEKITQNNPSMWQKVSKAAPLGRYGTAVDVAKSIVFLASTDASYITGVELNVDGGLVLNIGGGFTTYTFS